MKLTLQKIYPLVVLMLFICATLLVKIFGVTINITPSMKEGIYIKSFSPIKRGDIVAACLMDPYKTIGLKNFYIAKENKCDGADPVIKKVIAVPGDDVVLTDDYILVNNEKLFFKTIKNDSAGKILRTYPRGTYTHTKGYWLIGTNSLNSWDSRYWGFVVDKQIMYGLRFLAR